MTRRVMLTIFIGGLSIVGCAGHPWDPFLVPRPMVEQETKMIVLSPVSFSIRDLQVADTLLAKFDSLIAESLRQGGFQTVPARIADSVWRHLRDSAGGFFDPNTGVADSVRVDSVETEWQEILERTYGADAFLTGRIVVVPAKFSDGKARWDGVSESYESFGATLVRALFGVHGMGQTTALSLWVMVRNRSRKPIYLDEGGIQLLERPTRSGFERVANSELLTDADRARHAVTIALGPLVARDSTMSH